ncbi:hypothetical protein DV738_g471, partial [Chaetothyriales sp. CBS 135597]
MLTGLVLLLSLVMAEGAARSPENLMPPLLIVQTGVANALPTPNAPRNLPFVPGPAGFTALTAVNVQGAGEVVDKAATAATTKTSLDESEFFGPQVTAPSQILHTVADHVKREEERVVSDEPLLGITIPATTAVTITLFCQVDHTFYSCNMPMNGLAREVCLTADGQILCHVPFATPTPFATLPPFPKHTPLAAPEVLNTSKTTPLTTEVIPGVAVASTPIATAVSSDIEILTTLPTTIPGPNVAIPTTLPATLDRSHLTSPSLLNHSPTNATSDQKVNDASSNGRASFNQVLVGIALGVIVLLSL